MADYLLVDGYNIIFAWDELKELAAYNFDAARGRLQDILSNYQGYKKVEVIVVFDGYKCKGNLGSIQKYHNIHVIYTKEAETADQYIEKITGEFVKEGGVVRVATSDRLEQIIIMGQGASRVSARELEKEVSEMNRHIRKHYTESPGTKRNSLIENLSPEMAAFMQELRLKETKEEHEATKKTANKKRKKT